MWWVRAVNWCSQNTTWHGIFTGNFVVNVDMKELITVMNKRMILWDFTVQCDRKSKAKKRDIVFTDKKEKEAVIIDVAIPGDNKVKDKKLEKIEKYQFLKDEIACEKSL